jgi:hypothetical protein
MSSPAVGPTEPIRVPVKRMEAHKRSAGQLRSFLTSALDGGWAVSLSFPAPNPESPVPVGLEFGRGPEQFCRFGEEKKLMPLPELESRVAIYRGFALE